MRVLIIGGAGMLGHKLSQLYPEQFETWTTMRSSAGPYAGYNIFDPAHTLIGVDASDFDSLIGAMGDVRPDVVINCVGIIKQLKEATDPIVSLSINSLFPHRLAKLCRASGARLIHISTDCVFSGRKGNYVESDLSDAEDLYGRSKFLGEVGGEGALTLRTSIIGREMKTTSGLVEWFLANRGKTVKGYNQAIYTGFTTIALSRVIADVLKNHKDLSGVYQVSSDPIDKYELLLLMNQAFGANCSIEPSDDVVIDRSMNSQRFRTTTGFVPPTWQQMVSDMANDPTPYDTLRGTRES